MTDAKPSHAELERRLAEVDQRQRASAQDMQLLARQVIDGKSARTEQQIGAMVGEDAVQLLRHRAVEAAQSGLDVRQWQAELRRCQRAGKRRVRIAVDQHALGSLFQQHLLDALQHPSDLAGVAIRADAEVVVGRGNVELGEEDVGKQRVVVLAGVDEDFVVAACAARATARRP